MKVFTINAGSSSIRVAGFESCGAGKWRRLFGERFEGSGEKSAAALFAFLSRQQLDSQWVVVHRVVHGGGLFDRPVVVNDEVIEKLEQTLTLAPLHNPTAVSLLKRCYDLYSVQKHYLVFDTSYFSDLPAVASSYAIDSEFSSTHGIRRFGFHGLAHSSMYRQWLELEPEAKAKRAITFQLGSGCSAALIEDGKPLDTSMGFTPLEGLMMATRSGDIDPGLLLWLQKERGVSGAELEELLNNRSGLLGVSTESSRVDQLLVSDSEQAKRAIDLYCYRVRKYLGSYLAVAGKVDAIIFGGGVGENSWAVRQRVVENLEWLGVVLDRKRNQKGGGLPVKVSGEGSGVSIWVIGVDEEIEMVKEVLGE